MPQHPTARPSVSPPSTGPSRSSTPPTGASRRQQEDPAARPIGELPSEQPEGLTRQAAKVSDRATVQASAAAEEKKGADLTLNQVVAGAGAAATSAVLGSYFGATGTVAGAALGSVASAVATTLYKHSLDRTRDTIAARLQSRRGATGAEAPTTVLAVPRPRTPAEQPTVHLSVAPDTRPSRRRMIVGAVVTVVVFTVGLIVVTGLEWAKGSSLTTGQPGTSVGRVLSGGNGTQDRESRTSERSVAPTTEPSASTEQTPDSSDEATPSLGPSATTAPTENRDEDSTRSTDESPDRSGARSAEPSVTPTLDVSAPFEPND